jgi:hypothetical protein
VAEHADSLRDLRFAVELRGQFEGLAKVAPRQRTSRNVLASLQRRRWLVAATVSLCVVGAMTASVYLGVPFLRTRHAATAQSSVHSFQFVPSGSATSAPRPPAWLATQAQRVAVSNGDGAPTSATFSLTIMRDAAPAVGEPGDVVEDPALRVYLVVLTGHFSADNAFTPGGGPVLQGTTIAYIVDASSHIIHAFGLTDGPANATEVGHLTPFSLPTAGPTHK